MTIETACRTLKGLAAVEDGGPANLEYALRTRKLTLHAGNLAAAATALLGVYVPRAIKLTRVRLVPGLSVAAHATDGQVFSLVTNDGAGGSDTSLGSWSTLSGAQGALTAGTAVELNGFTANTSVAAGVYLMIKVAAAASGKASNCMLDIDCELIGS